MGIYDRDYFRREGPSYLDSLNVRGQATRWLLAVTIVVFVLQLITREQNWQGRWQPGIVTTYFALEPDLVLSGQVWRLISYAFVHDDGTLTRSGSGFWVHIFFNMWLLWAFGSYLEDFLGRRRFLTFYLTAVLVGGLGFLAERILTGRLALCVGASGAITALLIMCAFHNPRLNLLLFFVIPTPIWVLAILQVAQDVLGLLGGGGRTAFSVHLAGAAFGALYFQVYARLGDWGERWRFWRKLRSRPRLRVFHPESEEHVPVSVTTPASSVDEQFEAKVDAVLEKVARHGKDSLTESEQQILLRASEFYKRRRT